MRLQKEANLKKLLESVPHGFFVDSKWLNAQGISRQLVTKYLKSGWLERAAHGLYRRPVHILEDIAVELPEWEMLVLSMQHLMGHEVHVGGSTALRKRGHGHYVSMGSSERVFLYGTPIPSWIKSVQTNAEFELRNRKLFLPHDIGLDEDKTPKDGPQSPWRWSLKMSSPERAILEALKELPGTESFHTVDMMFQGLVNLRPRSITALLESCTNVQVKRLFFVYADRHDHAWRKHVDEKAVDLGSGDRSLVKGGKLHPKYRITIPEDLMPTAKGVADENP
jgi:Transcriptional regulator, AbiEi antitoxin, Type IV TA system/Transcriptional regulator, AbiEi antitoxin N-terminal domain